MQEKKAHQTSLKRVLLLCSANSIRSPVAEALWHEMCPQCEVYSAGALGQGRLHALAEQVVAERGLDLSQFRSHSAQEFLGQQFDLVVTLSAEAGEKFPEFPGAERTLHWPIPDPMLEPLDLSGTSPGQGGRIAAFRRMRDEIERQIAAYLRAP